MQISAYTAGDEMIWIPVNKGTGGKGARAFLPTDGLNEMYSHGYKADMKQNKYLQALIEIQNAFINNESKMFRLTSGKEERQYKARWRHGRASAPGLGPTGGWVQIRFDTLETVTAADLAVLAASDSTYAEHRHNSNNSAPLFVPVLAEARTFQLKFRENALQIWPPCCAISGATTALEAAHIKPVAASKLKADEITDRYNSIILNVALHRLFDLGFFSFSAHGKVLVSPLLSAKDQDVYGLNKEIHVAFHPAAQKYLDFHRAEVHRAGA